MTTTPNRILHTLPSNQMFVLFKLLIVHIDVGVFQLTQGTEAQAQIYDLFA